MSLTPNNCWCERGNIAINLVILAILCQRDSSEAVYWTLSQQFSNFDLQTSWRLRKLDNQDYILQFCQSSTVPRKAEKINLILAPSSCLKQAEKNSSTVWLNVTVLMYNWDVDVHNLGDSFSSTRRK